MNVVALQGHLARPAEQRTLPSGSRLVTLELTVAPADLPHAPAARTGPVGHEPTPGKKTGETSGAVAGTSPRRRPQVATQTRAETAPVVWFDAPAWAGALDADAAVLVIGRVRRRFFRAGGATQSRVEVVAERVVPLSSLKRVRIALAELTAVIEAAAAG